MANELNSLKQDIKDKAQELGADLVGIASVDRFAKAPDGFKPIDLMPDAQSVVVLAKSVPKEIIKNSQSLSSYVNAFETTTRLLDQIALDLAIYLEKQGGRALPVPADSPYAYWDPDTLHGMGDLSHRHAGVAAGLGTLGKNTLLLTPEFGNRVLLVSIITDIQLEADPLSSKAMCLPKCRLCIEACPVGALDGTRVIQSLCRPKSLIKLPRGFDAYGCWECRRVCPVNGTL
jgi:epoxyqueuosine reductase QueG